MKPMIALVFALCWGISANGANIVIVNSDDPGEGFNDPTPAAPEGGNTGTTRGQQRLMVFQTAAKIWGALLKSNVTIHVEAYFDPIPGCSGGGGVLGAATPSDVGYHPLTPPQGLQANTLYSIALYESRANLNKNGSANEIFTFFNSDIDNGCLGAGTRFWYGIAPGVQIPQGTFALLPIILHELGHGLGFLTFVCTTPDGCGNTPEGGLSSGIPDIWTRFMHDLLIAKPWDQLTDVERMSSVVNDPYLAWTGPNVTAATSIYQPTGAGLDWDQALYLRLYAPWQLEPGSSASHWTSDADNPNLLMEPALSPDIFNDTDITYSLFQDIGWLTNPRDTLFTDNFDTQ